MDIESCFEGAVTGDEVHATRLAGSSRRGNKDSTNQISLGGGMRSAHSGSKKKQNSRRGSASDDTQNNGPLISTENAIGTSMNSVGQTHVRKVPENAVESIPIPRTMAAFSTADKTMWDMRKAGKGWEEIRLEWERITGQRVAGTTLPNRFVRIKENIGDFNGDDDELLLRCKQELEKTFSDELWSMISEAMTSKGGNKFSAAAIHKRFKQLCEDFTTDN